MKAVVIKDWEHCNAPISKNGKREYLKGETIEINSGGYIDGVKAGFLLDPENPPVDKKPKKEKASSKANKETR